MFTNSTTACGCTEVSPPASPPELLPVYLEPQNSSECSSGVKLTSPASCEAAANFLGSAYKYAGAVDEPDSPGGCYAHPSTDPQRRTTKGSGGVRTFNVYFNVNVGAAAALSSCVCQLLSGTWGASPPSRPRAGGDDDDDGADNDDDGPTDDDEDGFSQAMINAAKLEDGPDERQSDLLDLGAGSSPNEGHLPMVIGITVGAAIAAVLAVAAVLPKRKAPVAPFKELDEAPKELEVSTKN